MKTLLNKIGDSLLAVMIFLLLVLFSFTAAFGQEERRVVITGQVIVPQGNAEPAYACLLAHDGEEMEVMVRANGRFWVNAPEAASYTLQFDQFGSMAKEVVVDARHAAKSVGSKKDRKIQFDVVLHADDTEGAMCYDAPVGRITFHHSNGRMKVKHHYQIVSAAEVAVPAIAAGQVEKSR